MDATGYQVVTTLSCHPRHCTDGCDWLPGCDNTVLSPTTCTMDVTDYQVVMTLSSHPRHCTDGCDWLFIRLWWHCPLTHDLYYGCDWLSGCDNTVLILTHDLYYGCDWLSGCDIIMANWTVVTQSHCVVDIVLFSFMRTQTTHSQVGKCEMFAEPRILPPPHALSWPFQSFQVWSNARVGSRIRKKTAKGIMAILIVGDKCINFPSIPKKCLRNNNGQAIQRDIGMIIVGPAGSTS